jgi:diaminohydroxyphosphoribosylaminopyrimidine deaminase/5-amino-6-(5-phosphoribosylamino)uracil reductase
VVAPHPDPFGKVAGRGFRRLRAAGVRVEVGDGEAEASRLNEAYLLRSAKGRPWVDVKAAATLDGMAADARGASRWITGEGARRRGHELRWAADAIVVGIGTILGDDPLLTARRQRETREPLRVVLDARLRTPVTARILREGDPARVRIASLSGARQAKKRRLEAMGAEVWEFGARRPGEIPLLPLLRRLAREGANRVLVEGGPRVAGAFLVAGLADRLHLFVAPKALGEGLAAFRGIGALPLSRALFFEIEETACLGEDLEIRLRRRR